MTLLLASLVVLVVVEIGARVLVNEPDAIRGKPLGPVAFADAVRHPIFERELAPPLRLDRTLGFALASDQDALVPFAEAPSGSYRVRTNLLGLRDERALVPKDPGTYRILALGDGMTFGAGVEREEAFPAILERALGSELGRPLDVVNAAVPCWSQREEVAFLEHRAQELQPDYVLLEVTVANDVLRNLRYRETAGDPLPDPDAGVDLAEHFLFELPFADTSRAYRFLMWRVGRHAIRYRAMLEPARLERTRRLLRRAHEAATSLHARFAVVLAPPALQATAGLAETLLRTRRVNEALLAICKEEGILALDPIALLRSSHAEGKPCYFARDLEWNARGHSVVGERLAAWIAPQLRP